MMSQKGEDVQTGLAGMRVLPLKAGGHKFTALTLCMVAAYCSVRLAPLLSEESAKTWHRSIVPSGFAVLHLTKVSTRH